MEGLGDEKDDEKNRVVAPGGVGSVMKINRATRARRSPFEAQVAFVRAATALGGMGLVPRTAVLGSVLLTGYLGGAMATHVRMGSDPFSLLFPVIFGVLLWGGLYLRDPRLRAAFSSRLTETQQPIARR
jgi:hypothetical protein